MVFLPSSPTRIYSIRRSKISLSAPRANQTLPDPPSEKTESPSSSGIINSLGVINTSMATSSAEHGSAATSASTDGNSYTISEIGEMLPTTQYHAPSTAGDANSDSEFLPEDDDRPVLGRASSVRVSKPQLVEHRPLSIQKSTVQSNEDQHSRSISQSSFEAEDVSETTSHVLPVMPEEDVQERTDSFAFPVAMEGEAIPTASNVPLGITSSEETAQSTVNPHKGVEVRQYKEIDFAHVHPDKAVETTSSSSPVNKTQMPPLLSREDTHADVCGGLPSELDAPSSSPFPISRGLSRRVTIRPADLVIYHADRNASFRESVVTTPYPPRRASDQNSMILDGSKQDQVPSSSNNKGKGATVKKFTSTTIAPSNRAVLPNEALRMKGEKDRFPSPERSEVLFVNLTLLNHPAARATLEIQIFDKSTFDDEMLFQKIRKAYSNRLLGLPRLMLTLVRKVGYATITSPANYQREEFDSINFIRHFNNPQLGRKRKAWVIWLRNNNPRRSMSPVAPLTSVLLKANELPEIGSSGSQPIRKLGNLKALSPCTQTSAISSPISTNQGRASSQHNKSVHTDHDAINADLTRRLSNVSDSSSFHFIYSPTIPRLPFLSSKLDKKQAHWTLRSPGSIYQPLSSSSYRQPSYGWSQSMWTSSTGSNTSGGNDTEDDVKMVTVSFHHQYRVGAIVAITILNLLMAVLVTVIWVIFGVPGMRPEVEHGHKLVGSSGHTGGVAGWEVDARKRVLTGVVIGLVTLLVGCVGEGAVIWAARELL